MTNSDVVSIESSLPALLVARAQAAPQAVAVEFEGQSLTYAELDARSNQLARFLQSRGVGRDVLVGLLAERSLEMVVALLAILKAGGAYVPLDASHGNQRLEQILDEAQVRLLLGHSALLGWLGKTRPEAISLDGLERSLAGIASDPIAADVQASDLAYVIFTSGSTGRPKGVEIEHRSLVNLLRSMLLEPGFDASDRLLAVTTLAFDIAGLEMYLPLIAGGRVIVASRDATYDGKQLARLLERSQATIMQATPVTWRLLLASGWQGNRNLKALVGGEALSPELARELTARCGEVWNLYGPTETTIWSSLYRVNGSEERAVPIGRPIADTAFHILSDDRRPVASGHEGELYIGGAGLARGYLGRPDLTSERFVPDPFSPLPGARLYRTGDLARLDTRGNVEFLGRIDHQVKIRGFRIELGEIEAVLEQHPAVRQAVAVARENRTGEKQIVAYVVPDAAQAANAAQLRQHLSGRVPDYMLPAAFIEVAEFPLTANGKIDRKTLPAPKSSERIGDRQYVAPRNSTERKLAALWEQVLDVRPIGVTTSFFELGGRSLQAARLFMKIGRSLGSDLPISTLFRAPTIEQLAHELHPQTALDAYRTLVPIQPLGPRQPFFCIHGGAGSTLFLRNLAKELEPEQPFYGIEPEGLDGKRFQRFTVEDMAAHYVSEIRKIQPHGPYLVGGYCFGGIVAFEMAQQLHRAGEKASLVALFSAPLRFNRPRAFQAPISEPPRPKEPRGKILSQRLTRLRYTFPTRMRRGAFRFMLDVGCNVPPFLRSAYVDHMLQRAEWFYVPKPYPGTVHLFRGRGLYDNDPGMGWQGLAGQLQHHLIGKTQTHLRHDIMDEPLVALLAKELTEALAGVSGEFADGRESRIQSYEPNSSMAAV